MPLKVQRAKDLPEAIKLAGLTGRKFAQLVGVREETVSRWAHGRCPRVGGEGNEMGKLHAFLWTKGISVTVCGVPLGARDKGEAPSDKG